MRNTLPDLPKHWQGEIKALRAENARYRRERNDSRDENSRLRVTVSSMRARLDQLNSELAALRTLTDVE